MISVDDMTLVPWHRGIPGDTWFGDLVSIDGTPNHDLKLEDVARVVAYGETSPDWDGRSAGIVELHDGRLVAWEAAWGPTGDDFHADAYGGGADVGFASSVEAALSFISERARELLVFAEVAS